MRVWLGRKTLRRLLEQADVSVRLNEMTGDGEWAEGPTRHDPLSPLWEKITKYPRNVLLGHVRKQVAAGCTALQWRVALRRLLSASVVNPFRDSLARVHDKPRDMLDRSSLAVRQARRPTACRLGGRSRLSGLEGWPGPAGGETRRSRARWGAPAVGTPPQGDPVVVDPAVVLVAHQGQVVDVGAPAQDPVLHVVGLAQAGRGTADHAAPVAGHQRPPLLGRDPPGPSTVVHGDAPSIEDEAVHVGVAT